jgi:catechol 2,3-dioxygenase-like lactoylglutathione lyase family enzyme
MKSERMTESFVLWEMILTVLLLATIIGMACNSDRQPQPDPETTGTGKVMGLAFDCLQVSSLERSIEYYRTLGFTVSGDTNPPWIEDEAANNLYKTPGAKFRTATLKMNSTVSGQPFTLYLREYKGIDRGDRVDYHPRNPSSSHIGIVVPEADALWAKMQDAGMLRPLSWEGKLVRMPGQSSGGIAYVRDPDGLNVEIIGIRQEAGAGRQMPDNHPSFHHLGLVVLNPEKSKAFYGDLLGAEFPEGPAEWLSGDMYDAAVGGRGYVIRLINGSFPEAAAPKTAMRFELVEYQNPIRNDYDAYRYSDVTVHCIGLQVEGIDALYARLRNAGVETWSEGGIVQLKDSTRSVVVRDPDVGAFIELFEKQQL